MTGGVRVDPALTIPEAELDERFGPSGGPGGQHANRAHTRVELRWDVSTSAVLDDRTRARLQERLGDLVRVIVDDERSQHRNREIARTRLGVQVADALRPRRVRTATRPTRGSQRRRLQAKRARGEIKRSRGRPTSDE